MVALTPTTRNLLATAAIALSAIVPAASGAATRPPIDDCGDVATIDRTTFIRFEFGS